MKKLYSIITILVIAANLCLPQQLKAQSPEKMSYQAVIRDAGDKLVTNQTVGMQISILQGSANGTAIYTETQTPTSNANGLVSIEIGGDDATVVIGGFSGINWSNGNYFIKTETDPTGGTNYTITGTSQLLSVPYALHAKTAESVTGGINETDPVYAESEAANITSNDISNLNNLSGTNTGDQDLSALATQTALEDTALAVRADIPDVSRFVTEETDPAFTNWNKDYSDLINKPITITAQQASDITANNAKVGYSDALVSANADVLANTAKTGITTAQANEIAANTLKTGITTQQANDITANNAKVGYTDALVSANADVVVNTAKTGITTAQVDAIIANTGKDTTGIYHANRAALDLVSGTNTGDQTLSGLGGIASNTAITGATKTKITYDTKGLVTAGEDATTADIAASTDKNYVTDAQLVIIGNTSNTNTGDQNLSSVLAQNNDGGATQIKNIADPTANQDAATKAYVDALEHRVYILELKFELITNQTAISELLDSGASVSDLLAAGVDVFSLLMEGVSLSDLLAAGADVCDLLSAGVSVSDLLATGANVYALSECRSVSVSDLLTAGVSVSDLLTAGVSVSDLVTAGASVSDLLTAGVSVSDLLTAGVPVSDLLSAGVSVSDLVTAGANDPILIGKEYNGGKIAYILQRDDPGYVAGETHGLIAAASDQSEDIQWYNGSYTTTGSTETTLGTGNANTTAIITNQGAGSYAAQVCADLVLGGYTDWYLPSKEELNKLYINEAAVGGFAGEYYWSSSESSNFNAWMQHFGRYSQVYEDKEEAYNVRAVREF